MAVDVAGRLSEGFAALDHTQTYVSACAVRGYHHPDLTVHSAQVRDWYGTEDGLDLNALDADCVAMRGAAQAAAEALRCVQVSLDWSGEGAAPQSISWPGTVRKPSGSLPPSMRPPGRVNDCATNSGASWMGKSTRQFHWTSAVKVRRGYPPPRL